MDSSFPEELLQEVLRHAIIRPMDDFSQLPHLRYLTRRVHGHAPGSRRSCILVVCRRWYRVALPLLYTRVRLAEPEHTKAVARVVQHRPELGGAIRHLRLDGGHGKELYALLKLAPNVESLYLSLDATSKDSVAGFRRAVKEGVLRARVLYYTDASSGSERNKVLTELLAIAQTHIAQSKSLTHVILNSHEKIRPSLAEALQKSPSLTDVTLYADTILETLKTGLFQKIATNPSVRIVHCRGQRDKARIEKHIAEHGVAERVLNLIAFEHDEDEVTLREMWAEEEHCHFN
ncbi:hypothetical protein PsYK624_079540 [Phanerochaete sordida]|uniref:F-box domain-containing protein n=1 Tax=Phanerochaete sordida TaxID=48140 RepID=A0A9P3G9D8_9APHY|nr:hypothetical protein PsYK624_079540 [Phanerochaete sordida]